MSEPSTSQQKAKEKAVDPEPTPSSADEGDHSDSEGSEDEDERAGSAAGSSSGVQATTPSTSSKKKKKKRSKAIKALSALRGGSKDAIPDDVVKIVLEKVRAEGGEAAANADSETVRKALEQMKLKEVIQGNVGIGGINRKDTGGHKVSSLSVRFSARPRSDCGVCIVLVDTTRATTR